MLNAEEQVRASLVDLAREPAAGDVELEHRMAGRQGHPVEVRHVPRRHHEPPRFGKAADLLHHRRDLIDRAAVRRGPGTPLPAVHRPQIAVLVAPLVPDGHPVTPQIGDVRAAREEPEQLVDDGAEMDPLGRHQRKPPAEVEAHLVAEEPEGAGPRPVVPANALAAHPRQQIEILSHEPVSKLDSATSVR